MWLKLQVAGVWLLIVGENTFILGRTEAKWENKCSVMPSTPAGHQKNKHYQFDALKKMLCQQEPGVGECCVPQADNDSILQARTQLHTSLRQGLLRACCTSWVIGTLNWHVDHGITAVKAFFSVLKPCRFCSVCSVFLGDILHCCTD